MKLLLTYQYVAFLTGFEIEMTQKQTKEGCCLLPEKMHTVIVSLFCRANFCITKS